ncbi:MAG: DUF2919 family protein [Thalassotalea sp.]
MTDPSANYNRYKNYTINDFDSFDCLKLSKGLYLSLFFVLRGYVVWLVSVANMKDHTSFIALVFPDTTLFYLSLLSGAVGLIVLLLISLRKPSAPAWVQSWWPKTRVLLVAALLFDLTVSFIAYYQNIIWSPVWLFSQIVIVMILVLTCFRNQRLEINLSEFPAPLKAD